MGLDMYLYAEKHISQWDYETVNNEMVRRDNLDYDKANQLVREMPTAEFGGITIKKCVAYWRKANAIHGWIVRNCANGVDECQEIYLSREDLLKLREACHIGLQTRDNPEPDDPMGNTINFTEGANTSAEQNVNNIMAIFAEQMAKRLSGVNTATEDNPIPPTEGFFFGSGNKDEWYYRELAETIETINALIASDPDDKYTYIYRASW